MENKFTIKHGNTSVEFSLNKDTKIMDVLVNQKDVLVDWLIMDVVEAEGLYKLLGEFINK